MGGKLKLFCGKDDQSNNLPFLQEITELVPNVMIVTNFLGKQDPGISIVCEHILKGGFTEK